jgi:hypothetical protein
VAFDALEFDRKLRDIDVISEIAFLVMDLHAHDRAGLGYEVLSRYLEVGGDYGGIDVLPFYLVYRALVRAKVASIKRAQSAADGHEAERYLETAIDLAARKTPLLVITHGLSGSGKTTVTDELVSRLPAIRARSDLERKRLHGLAATARSGSGLGTGLYAAAASERTYAALAEIARTARNGQRAHRRHSSVPRPAGVPTSRRRQRSRFAILDWPRRPSCGGASAPAGRDASRPIWPSSSGSSLQNLSIGRNGGAVTVDTERAFVTRSSSRICAGFSGSECRQLASLERPAKAPDALGSIHRACPAPTTTTRKTRSRKSRAMTAR